MVRVGYEVHIEPYDFYELNDEYYEVYDIYEVLHPFYVKSDTKSVYTR